MEFREDVSFDLKGFSPTQLCALPRQGCLVAASAAGRLRSLDLVSGTQLHDTEVGAASPPLLCQYHEQSGKLVVGAGRNFGARGVVGGTVMLHTLLQPPAADSEKTVAIELSLTQAEVLWSELEGFVLPRNPAHSAGAKSGGKQGSWSTRLASVIAQLARGVRKTREEDGATSTHLTASKWKTVCFKGPVQELSSLFEDMLTKMRSPRSGAGAGSALGYHPPGLSSSSSSSSATSFSPSPALPLVAAISLRLRLLHPDQRSALEALQGGGEVKDNKMVYCEAVRRLSLAKWPHKDYVWAVPPAMAAAGFFHLAGTSHLPNSGLFKADRVSCFACHVYLYSWEPNDEPWSEHERHAMQCPFMRGDSTENIPLDVTEGTHPAVNDVTSDPNDGIAFMASSAHSGLVAVATKQGVLSTWDVGGSLCVTPHARLNLTTEVLQGLLQTHPVGTSETRPATCSNQQEKITNFSLSSLSLLSPPGDSQPVLVTAVRLTHSSGPAHPLLLLHSVVDTPPSGTPPMAASMKGAAPITTGLPAAGLYPEDLDLPLLPDGLPFPPDLPPHTIPFLSHPLSSTLLIPVTSLQDLSHPLPTLSTPASSLHDILADPSDTGRVGPSGSLAFLSVFPLSPALSNLEGDCDVRLTLPLPASHLLAVYVQRTRPQVNIENVLQPEIKGKDDESPCGCLLLLSNRGEEVCLCPEPVVSLVTMCPGEVIVDMCRVEVGETDARDGKQEWLVAVTAQGELRLLSLESLEVLASRRDPSGCGYCCCTAWESGGGWVAVATVEGKVDVVRVCERRGEDEVLGAGTVDSGATDWEQMLLTQPLTLPTLDHLLSLTHTSPVGVAYSSSAPQHWQEISLQQFHRRTPTHMHVAPGDGESHTPSSNHTRVWQYLPPPTVKTARAKEVQTNSEYQFELSLDSGSPPLGCVSVCFCLPSARCLSDTASLSLLLPLRGRGEEGGDERAGQRERWVHRSGSGLLETAEVLCGPVLLKPLVDVTGCSVQASFTHPLLLTSPPPLTLALRLEQLFPADYSEAASSAAEAHAPNTVRMGTLRRRGYVVRHGATSRRLQQMSTRGRVVPEQCYLSLCLYPLCEPAGQPEMPVKMDVLLRLISKRDFILQLVLGVCGYRVVKEEYSALPVALQAVVDSRGSRVEGAEEGAVRVGRGLKDGVSVAEAWGGGGKTMRLQCLQLLCWVGGVQGGVAGKEGKEVVRTAIGQLMVSLLHACFFSSDSRQTAHRCSRLIVSLHRPQELTPSAQEFSKQLLCALPPLLPLLPLCASAACVHWFLRILSVVVIRSHDQHMISQHCLRLLVELARQLQAKSTPLPQLLHTYFGQDGSVFEDTLYDIYLSYYQRSAALVFAHKIQPSMAGMAASLPSHTSLHWGQLENTLAKYTPSTPAPLVHHNSHPPGGAAPTQSSPVLMYAEKKSQSIYDAELKLLLSPPPKAPDQAAKILGEFSPYQHGSFLLYGQRGLLETYPLQYTCCSVTGNATVQEQVLLTRNGQTSSSSDPSPQPSSLPAAEKTSGYCYPSGPGRNSSRAGWASPSMASLPSHNLPSELSEAKILPKELLMSIDVLQSGQVYSAILKFSEPVFLTDMSLSTNPSMGCVSVDVWEGGDEGDGAVRVAQCTEIQEKNLMLGNLMPPPLCQFVKVTYTGKLGASREKAQVFLGAFYGIPLLSKPSQLLASVDPLGSRVLRPLEQRLLSVYRSARDKLTASLTVHSSAVEGGPAGCRKQLQDRVRERYQACFLAQARLARIRNYANRVGNGGETAAIAAGGVFSVEEEAAGVEFAEISLSQLYRLAGCLVNTLLVLCGPADREDRPTSTAPLAVSQLPAVAEEDCRLLLSSLCVHGVLRVQARVCGLLLRLCGAQPWWGDMVVATAASLFTASQTASFNKERAMLQLSALCQRSHQHSPVLTCLLHTLSSLLSPFLTPSGPPSPATSVDHWQLQWLVLLLSHCLSSLHSSSQTGSHREPNLFGPSLNIPTTQHPPRASGSGAEKMSVAVRYLGIRASSRRQTASLGNNNAPPTPSPSSPLPSLPSSLAHKVTRGLLAYVLSLIDQYNWDMIPVVCKAISLLAILSSHPLPLTTLLASSQLTLLLSTACTPLTRCRYTDSIPGNRSPGNTLGNQQWACRSVQWMVCSVVYHGDIAPHLERSRREAAEREGTAERDVVGHVEEAELPTREEAEVLARGPEDAGKKGDGGKEVGNPGAATTKKQAPFQGEAKPLPLHPLLLEWEDATAGGGPEAEQEYELVSWMAEQEPFGATVLPSGTAGGELLPTSFGLLPVSSVSYSSIVTSDLKPVALSPPPASPPPPVAVADTALATGTPPLLPKSVKPKKKLSKHHVKSFKYAPGDYTEVPLPRPADPDATATASSSADLNPYRSFVISSSVDHRLQHSLELPAELQLQAMARAEYEAVLVSLVTAMPAGLPGSTAEGARAEEGRVEGEAGLEKACEFIRKSLEQLLASLLGPQPSLDTVAVLQLWSELNTLFPAPHGPLVPSPPPPPPRMASLLTPLRRNNGSEDPLPSSEPLRQQPALSEKTQLSFCSPELLVKLTDFLCDTPSSVATWQVGLSLLRQFIRHLSTPHTPSIPLPPSQLSRVLLAYFLSGEGVGVAGGVVLDLLKELTPLQLTGTSVSGDAGDGGNVMSGCEGVGAHVLLEVLTEILEQRDLAVELSALYPLLEALGRLEVPRFLFPPDPIPCTTALTCIHRLLTVTVSLVHSTLLDAPWRNVQLYAADLEGDRMRYRYRTSGGGRLKWIPLPHGNTDSTHRSKVTSDLIQLVRQLLSISATALPDSAHKAIQEFTTKGKVEEQSETSESFNRRSFPLTQLVYSDPGLLSLLLSLLNSLNVQEEEKVSPAAAGKPPPPPPLPSVIPGTLYVNFVHFLYLRCPDCMCFFQPMLEVLGSTGEDTPISRPFLSFVGRLTSDLAQDGNHRQLEQFISQGGARLVFECLVRSCQGPSLSPSPSALSPSSPSSSSSSSSVGTLASTILRLGQRDVPKPFQEGSNLINFLPLASLRLNPDRTPVQDLQAARQGDPPSRSSTFHHTFQLREEELVMTATLPHPILFCGLQLFQPTGSLQNGPSSLLIETSSRPGLAPPLPATPTINTKGLGCIKIELHSPVVAQEVKVHFYRPAVSEIISLSHMYLLGMGYGGAPGEGEAGKKMAESADQPHPSCIWLGIVDHWLALPEATRQRLLEEASGVPHLLPTCLSLVTTHQRSPSSTASNQLLRLLLALAARNPDYGHTLVKHLMGFSSETTPTATPPAVELFHCLCVPDTEHGMQRLSLCLRLLSSLPRPHPASLPVLVRALSSVVWHGDAQRVVSLLSDDLFSSLAEVAISSPMDSSLKPALNSLLCSLCSHASHLFTLLLDRCLTAFTATEPHLPPDLPPLLFTLAHAAQSPTCSPILLSSLLLPSITTELRDSFTQLASHVTKAPTESTTTGEDGDDSAAGPSSAHLPRLCALLAFLTDLSRHWLPAKAWLGSGQQSALWPPLVQFLSLAEHCLLPLPIEELNFVQDVAIEFFQAVLQGSTDNKTQFSRLLTNAIQGFYSMETRERNEQLQPAMLTAFLYRLIIDLVLDPEHLPVLLQLPQDGRGDIPSVSLSLPLTYESPSFHPSLPVSQHSHLTSLPHSVPTAHLLTLGHVCNHAADDEKSVKVAGKKQPPSSSEPEEASVKLFEYKTLDPLQTPGLPGGSKGETSKSILKGAGQPTRVSLSGQLSLSLADSPETVVSVQTRLSELLATHSSPLHVLSLTIQHPSKPPATTESKADPSPTVVSPPPSLLETFAKSGGLLPLALCLPSLYPHLWPSVSVEEEQKEMEEERETAGIVSSPRPFSLASTPATLFPHALVTFGLCLRLRCYGDALLQNPPMARVLLRMLLCAEYKEPIAKAVSEQQPFVPYLLLVHMLRDYPAHTEVGVACREGVMGEGVIHQVLASLSSFGHHHPRTRHTETAQAADSASSPEQTVSRPGSGVKSGHRLYWAKGTGFGTGSTLSAWNVGAMRAKQKSEERYVCLCFAILCEYLSVPEGRGQGEESWCGPALADLLASSCLLPAMAAYLINDSILDISKHIELYQAALGLLHSLPSHPSLLTLLTLPVFSDGEAAAGKDELTLLSLSKKLKNIAQSYLKTAKLKSKSSTAAASTLNRATPTTTPTSSPSLPPRRMKVRATAGPPTPAQEEITAAEAELAGLISAMLATAESVAAAVREARGRKESCGQDAEQDDPQESSDTYMEAMRPLQFDTYQFLEEDEAGQLRFLSPFYYENRLQPGTATVYGAARGRRLAQEVSALATSLPLSPSSSVFVRCDEDRLDVMKVLITGPSDTPYANGCFEFDVFFPAEYPQGPMLINLMTTGQGLVRFNPNLYNDGKVCLSVLNTWHGRPEEKWNSETSSFLQVLVSIQSLVLVSDPYFNEPGYEQYQGTPYGDQKSLTYNANLYLATVQWAMLQQLQNPSPCFREVILKHFLLRREQVLSQCRQWEMQLVEGIERMQARGVATAHLKDYLRKLVKAVELLRVEIGKIKKEKLETAAADGHEQSDIAVDDDTEEAGHPDSNAGHPNSDPGHPDSDGIKPSSNTGHPDNPVDQPTSQSTQPSIADELLTEVGGAGGNSGSVQPQLQSEEKRTAPQEAAENVSPPSQDDAAGTGEEEEEDKEGKSEQLQLNEQQLNTAMTALEEQLPGEVLGGACEPSNSN